MRFEPATFLYPLPVGAAGPRTGKARSQVPAMRFYKPRNLARVRLGGRDIYLGPWGSQEARQRYDQVVGLWLAQGRCWPTEAMASTVHDVASGYAEWARGYYLKAGRVTKTAHSAAQAVQLLVRARLADREVEAFGPKALRQFQAWLAGDTSLNGKSQWSRATINEYSRHVVSAFRWAAEEEIPGASAAWHALKAVKPLRRGRPAAAGQQPPRDGRPREPVPDRDLEAVLAIAPPILAAMIRVQLATAMRPGEITAMQAGDLAPTVVAGVTCYRVRPESNKTDVHDIERKVFIGPRAMEHLRPWLPEDPDQHVFSPKRAEEIRLAGRRASRKSPRWPSHSADARRARRGQEPIEIGDRYTTDAYRRAIERLCARAGVTAWTPHQLRHNAATWICEHESIEVAQLVLGHQDIATTMIYVKVKDRRAMLAALKHG